MPILSQFRYTKGYHLTWNGAAGSPYRYVAGVANIVWQSVPDQYLMPDTDELVFIVVVTGVISAVMQLQIGNVGSVYGIEQILATGTVTGSEQRMTCYDLAWGPLAPRTLGYVVERPFAGVYFKVGIYGDGVVAPTATDTVDVYVLQRASM